MNIKLPNETIGFPEKITEFCYIAQEKLRLLHNQKGQLFRDENISRKNWTIWQRNYFSPRSSAISDELVKARPALPGYSVGSENDRDLIVSDMKKYLTSNRYIIDLDNDFEVN